MLDIWNDLSTQGKLYLVCQTLYFISVGVGITLLVQIRNSVKGK